jgi:Chaperone of endosialidase
VSEGLARITKTTRMKIYLKNFVLSQVTVIFALACFALAPQARAVCQEGCLTNANTVLGDGALLSLTTGTNNTAVGDSALSEDTTGSNNTATGLQALVFNSIGDNNTATGVNALYSSVNNGSFNTATGMNALFSNASFNNTATGFDALLLNTTGHDNIAEGLSALVNNTTGSLNIALGSKAGLNLTTGSNNIEIGNAGAAGESKHIRIGTQGTHTHTFIAGISGATVAGGVGVIIDTNGHLGTIVSSERFKKAVQPMDKASEAILALEPVTFRYREELDPAGIPQFGLVAEQVEKVDPDLVAKDNQGKPYTVRYEAVNAMLLNEFLKEHRQVQELKSTVTQQQQDFQSKLAEQQKQIEALTAGLQKVSAQLELSKAAPRTVQNSQ